MAYPADFYSTFFTDFRKSILRFAINASLGSKGSKRKVEGNLPGGYKNIKITNLGRPQLSNSRRALHYECERAKTL